MYEKMPDVSYRQIYNTWIIF